MNQHTQCKYINAYIVVYAGLRWISLGTDIAFNAGFMVHAAYLHTKLPANYSVI